MGKLVAIHQPNFFPWLGYFDKLARADVFIVLDHVQFPKTKGNWGNRVQLLVGRQPRWATVPIVRSYHGLRRTDEIEINDGLPWRRDLLGTLRMNYSRAAHFAEVLPAVEPLVRHPDGRLAAFNRNAVAALAGRLGIEPAKMVCSSALGAEGAGTDLLVALVRAVGGTAYLCGGGSSGYLEPGKFRAAGLDLVYQEYRHPVYAQAGAAGFVPGLSCLDALFNCGFAAVAGWLAGRGPC